MTTAVDCASGPVSFHAFSRNGTVWDALLEYIQPYSSRVEYEDGTSATFTSLERPKLFVDESGTPSHLFNAAFSPGSADCAPTSCTECKWNGTAPNGPMRAGQVGNASTIVRRLKFD